MRLKAKQFSVSDAYFRTRKTYSPDGTDFFEQAVVPVIFLEFPRCNVDFFGKIYLERAMKLEKLARDLYESKVGLKSSLPECRAFVKSYFWSLENSSLKFDKQLNSYRLASRFLREWVTYPTIDYPWGHVRYSLCSHPESPFSIELFSKDGTRLGTIGGTVFINPQKKVVVQLTNIQGKSLKAKELEHLIGNERQEALQLHAEKYAELNRAIGENWRVFFVKKVIELAKRKGYRVEGIVSEFIEPMISSRKRLERQYKQTYQKAGLKSTKKGVWVSPARKRARKK